MNLIRTIFASFIDLFRQRILMLVLIPPLASLALWGVLGFLFWDQILRFSQIFAEKFLYTQQIPQWMIDWFSLTPETVATVLAVVVAVLLILPLAILTSVLVTSFLAMPVVILQVGESFPDLKKEGTGIFRASVANMVKSSVIYLILWVLTLPLWMVPGLGFAIPILLNGYLNYRLFVFDSLAEYATLKEIREILKQKRIDFLLLGVITSMMIVLPVLYLILPVYSALCFTRLSLSELEAHRKLASVGT